MSDAFSKTNMINMLWAILVAIGMWNLNQISGSVKSLSEEIKSLNKFAVQALHSHDIRITRVEERIGVIEEKAKVKNGNQ